MVNDGEDWHGLQLKSLAKLFKPFNRDWSPLNSFKVFFGLFCSSGYQLDDEDNIIYFK